MGAKLTARPFSVDDFEDELCRVESLLSQEPEGFAVYAKRIIRSENREMAVRYVQTRTYKLRRQFPRLDDEEIHALILYNMELGRDDKSYNVYLQMNKAFARGEWLWCDAFRDCFFWLLSGLRKLPRATSRVLFRGISGKVGRTYDVNTVRTWVGFTSASTDIDVAMRFAEGGGTVFVICGKYAGRDISAFGNCSERTVMIEPCFRFRVLHVERGRVDCVVVEGVRGARRVLKDRLPDRQPPPDESTWLWWNDETAWIFEAMLRGYRGNNEFQEKLVHLCEEGILPREMGTYWERRCAGESGEKIRLSRWGMLDRLSIEMPVYFDPRSIVAPIISDNNEVKKLAQMADSGDKCASIELGLRYLRGDGVPQSFFQARRFIERYCSDDRLSNVFYDALRIEYKEMAVMFNIGAEMDINFLNAFTWFEKVGEKGIPAAQYNVGVYLDFGIGVEQDRPKAVEWYSKAAKQDFTEAQYNLGMCYSKGDGVEQDYAKAVYWFIKAAEQGNAQAQLNLGTMFAEGKGVEQDNAKAVYWWQRAAEHGDAGAQCNLGFSYAHGRGVEQDYVMAVYWFRKAAEQGQREAQYNFGVCCKAGLGIEKDPSEALVWFEKSAHQGHPMAQCQAGMEYMDGINIKRDDKKACYWFSRSADQGCVEAMSMLGLCYAEGLGVEQDEEKGLGMILHAAENGDENALSYLNKRLS